MREPYETLLGQYRDHPLMGRYVDGYDPDFAGLAASDVPRMISSGELIVWRVALAFHNRDHAATFADVLSLDDDNRTRVADALAMTVGVRDGW